MSTITLEEFSRIAHKELPLLEVLGFNVERLEHGECTVRAIYKEDFLRPGGTVSGPVMMALADFAMWGAIMSRAGRVQMAVTSNLYINFLIRPEPGDIVAEAKVIKLGKRLAVGVVELFGNDQQNDLVAHVTCTYSLPPQPNN
ncbi:MAG: PaaI family thioesterase [Gammaproteobacteria bacterium]|nr:PaaI family thioesterase [Gammaproteobacteria bacterium]